MGRKDLASWFQCTSLDRTQQHMQIPQSLVLQQPWLLQFPPPAVHGGQQQQANGFPWHLSCKQFPSRLPLGNNLLENTFTWQAGGQISIKSQKADFWKVLQHGSTVTFLPFRGHGYTLPNKGWMSVLTGVSNQTVLLSPRGHGCSSLEFFLLPARQCLVTLISGYK